MHRRHYTPQPKQQEFHESPARYPLAEGGRGEPHAHGHGIGGIKAGGLSPPSGKIPLQC
jgi:hypothetical protein